MAQAPTGGPQSRIRALPFLYEVIDYLAAQGVGVARRTLFLNKFPSTPTAATVVALDSLPIGSNDPASRPAFRVLLRDTDITTCAHRASIVLELLHHMHPPLASYFVFVTANHDPGQYYDDNQHPVFFIGFSTCGMVKRA